MTSGPTSSLPAAGTPRWSLTWEAGGGERSLAVSGRVRIGRAPDNDLVLDDPASAAYHCRIAEHGGRLLAEPASTEHGVFVNGERVLLPTPLRPGDSIRVGATRFRIGAAPAPAAPEARTLPLPDYAAPNAEPGSRAWLELPGGERRMLGAETRIGRVADNDLPLDDPLISRYHAVVRRIEGRYLLADLGSSNGTFLNDAPLSAPHALEPGDRVRFAGLEAIFRLGAPERAAPATPAPAVSLQASQLLALAGDDGLPAIRGDLKMVTVLFADLKNFTAMSERLTPDQVSQLMNTCFARLTRVTSHFGGYVDKYAGDSMMVLFGAPVAHEDDAERAVRAAIAMQSELRRFTQRLRSRTGIDLQMRIGINTGEVMAGSVGGGEFAAFTVMGDAVNLASRLEHSARVGHILVGDTTYRLTHQAVRYVAQPPLAVKGKAEPVQTYEVQDVIGAEPEPDAATGFVGRERELQALERLLAQPGGLRVATIAGESGAGASRLLSELRRRQAGRSRWATVRSAEYDQLAPYAALRDLARALLSAAGLATQEATQAGFETSGRHLAALARLLSYDLDPAAGSGDPRAIRSSLAAAFADLVAQLAAREPVVLALLDAQWTDADSLAVLDAAAPRLRDAPVLLLATARPGWDHPWPARVTRLELAPFSRAECTRVVADLLGSEAIDPAALDLIAERSAGSPLWLEELVRGALEAGTLREQDGRWQLHGELPLGPASGLRGVIQARLDGLPERERRLLQSAAVLGRSWGADLLGELLDDPHADSLRRLADRSALGDTLNGLVARGELEQRVEGGESVYRFRQDIVRDVSYASLPLVERRRLHERAALALERRSGGRPPPERLARLAEHWTRARKADKAARAHLRAAEEAAGLYADDVAEAQYRAALAATAELRQPNERRAAELDAHEGLGRLALRRGRLPQARAALEAALGLADAASRRGELAACLALLAVRTGDHRPALDLADAAAPDDAAAQTLAARALAGQGEARRATERAERAVALARAAGAERWDALLALGLARHLAGDLAGATDAAQRGLAAAGPDADPAGLAEAHGILAAALLELGRREPARAAARQAAGLAERAPLAAPDAASNPWLAAQGALAIGRVLLDAGAHAEAVRALEQAERQAESCGARELLLRARVIHARALLAGGRADAADALLRGIPATAEDLELRALAVEAHLALGEALIARGAIAEAQAATQAALVRARWLGLRLHEARANLVLAEAQAAGGARDEAAGAYDRAAGIFERLGARPEWARTLLAAAHAEQRLGGLRPHTRERLRRALDQAAAPGLEPELAALRRALSQADG